MGVRQFLELLLLAAIWGASFMFMRVLAPDFSALTLATLRIDIAALALSPIFFHYWTKRQNKPLSKDTNQSNKNILAHIAVVATINATIPAILFAYAAKYLNAGFSSILNATTPIWGALIGASLFAVTITRTAYLGIFIGFLGVFILSWHKLQWDFSQDMSAIAAILSGTALYGIAANYSKAKLANVKPLFIASASMLIACIITLPILIYQQPTVSDYSALQWLNLIGLGALSTGVAYLLYYRIIDHSGPTNAMTVTYLIPIFGLLFGWLLLDEVPHPSVFYGGAVILTGVTLTTGILKKFRSKKFLHNKTNI
jgi:drug/metabolite transporter (DMT)-like permease